MRDIQPSSVLILTTLLSIVLVISFWATSIFVGYIQRKPVGAQRLADFIYKDVARLNFTLIWFNSLIGYYMVAFKGQDLTLQPHFCILLCLFWTMRFVLLFFTHSAAISGLVCLLQYSDYKHLQDLLLGPDDVAKTKIHILLLIMVILETLPAVIEHNHPARFLKDVNAPGNTDSEFFNVAQLSIIAMVIIIHIVMKVVKQRHDQPLEQNQRHITTNFDASVPAEETGGKPSILSSLMTKISLKLCFCKNIGDTVTIDEPTTMNGSTVYIISTDGQNRIDKMKGHAKWSITATLVLGLVCIVYYTGVVDADDFKGNTVVAKCVFNLVVGAILPWSVILGNKNMKSYHKKRFSKFKNSTKDKIKSFKCKYNIVNPT